MRMSFANWSLLGSRRALPLVIAAATGCGSEAAEPEDDTAGSQPAILVGVIVDDPDARNIYVGAVPDVPEGELDYSGYLELGNVDLSTYGGWVFAWEREASTLTRFGVRADFSLFPVGSSSAFRITAAAASSSAVSSRSSPPRARTRYRRSWTWSWSGIPRPWRSRGRFPWSLPTCRRGSYLSRTSRRWSETR